MNTVKPWTVLIWSASDNQLYQLLQKDLKEAQQVGTTDFVNLVCQTSHQPVDGPVERLELHKGGKVQVQDLGPEIDMSSSSALADFVAWGVEKYPSEHTMLVIADHGGGWKGCCYSQSGKGSWMNLADVEAGLAAAQERTGKKLDVLGFDASLMASAEVAHQLAPYADFLVGPPDSENGNGWQYDEVVGNLGTPREAARGVVEMARRHPKDLPAMASLDTSRVPAFSAAMKQFSRAIVRTSVDLAPVVAQTQSYYGGKDVQHFAEGVRQLSLADPGLALAADQVARTTQAMVDAEHHSGSRPQAHGVGIEMDPKNLDRLDYAPYSSIKFAQDTGWDDAVRKIHAKQR